MTEIKRTQYWFYRVRGVCTKCGKEDAFTMSGRSYCAECNYKKNSRQREKFNTNPETRENNSKYCRERYWKLKKTGMCTACAKRKTKNGKAKCELCSAIYRMRHEINKPIGVGYFDETMCRRCKKNPPIAGKKLCKDCYNKSVAALEIARKKQTIGKKVYNDESKDMS